MPVLLFSRVTNRKHSLMRARRPTHYKTYQEMCSEFMLSYIFFKCFISFTIVCLHFFLCCVMLIFKPHMGKNKKRYCNYNFVFGLERMTCISIYVHGKHDLDVWPFRVRNGLTEPSKIVTWGSILLNSRFFFKRSVVCIISICVGFLLLVAILHTP